MTAPATQTCYATTAWRSVTGLVIGASVALLLSEGLVAATAKIAELMARSHGRHIFLPPAVQIGIGWEFIGFYIAVIMAACAPVWLGLRLWKQASWRAAIVLGFVGTAAAWGLSGAYRAPPDAVGVGFPFIGAFSGWLIWRVSYRRMRRQVPDID